MCYNTVIVTVFLAHFMSEANALRISMESNDDATEDVKSPRIVIWKQPHSGGTWIADMLKHEPTMKCFHHEIKCADKLKKWVSAPPCDCGCNSNSNATNCLMGANGKPLGIGFSKNADHIPGYMSEGPLGAIMLASEYVYPVHLIRTNFIRHALSYQRADQLKSKCGSKKVKGASMESCAKSLPQMMNVNTAKFIEFAKKLSDEQKERHEGIIRQLKKANKQDRLLTISYENLMNDAAGEMTRLLRHVGLLGPQESAQAQTRSVKITTNPLKNAISNFDELKMELQKGNHTCLLSQLHMEDHEHFDGWC
eukprot:gnl/MRDRNA2_/MRDRNA2_61600_c0_seq3.p1 gnl/MRDRNA2_/MRDRNA2_61600_c0~~gnl/MRDRNA2_/MRDRNA2_61600_c0_seq3.p1  ORF type:complete len:309 (+),score=57.23 gnl/MRDRNA2_/MRDRNA2_61600_c0_seq3:103-1029(+)